MKEQTSVYFDESCFMAGPTPFTPARFSWLGTLWVWLTSDLVAYSVKRILQGILTLFLASVLSFVIIQLTPGDYLDTLRQDPNNSQEDIARLQQQFGLGRTWSDENLAKTLKGLSSPIALSADGETLAGMETPTTLKIQPLTSDTPPQSLALKSPVTRLQFSPDGTQLAIAQGNTLQLQALQLAAEEGDNAASADPSTVPSPKPAFVGHTAPISVLQFSPAGEFLATGSQDTTVRLWQRDGQPLQTLNGATGPILSLAVSDDGQSVVASSEDKTLRLWAVDGTPSDPFKIDGEPAIAVRLSTDGKTLTAALRDGKLQQWSIADGTVETKKLPVPQPVTAIALSTDPYEPSTRQVAAILTQSRGVQVWNWQMQRLATLTGLKGPVQQLTLSLDGQHLAVVNQAGQVRIWETGQSIFKQYGRWLGQALRGNFGKSFAYQRDVAPLLLERAGATLLMAIASILVTWGIAIPLGIVAAVNQNRWGDRVLQVISYAGQGVPSFVTALVLLFLAQMLPIFPVGNMTSIDFDDLSILGKGLDLGWHLILPTLALSITSFAGLQRIMRGNVLDVLRQNYIQTARAKGLPENRVLYVHALRNAVNPLITLLGFEFAGLLSGAFIVESFFNWPGLGRLTLQAVFLKDRNLVMASLMMATALLIIGSLLADLLLKGVDPRIQLSGEKSR
jgi:peptide/nickel transport system permease protein